MPVGMLEISFYIMQYQLNHLYCHELKRAYSAKCLDEVSSSRGTASDEL